MDTNEINQCLADIKRKNSNVNEHEEPYIKNK